MIFLKLVVDVNDLGLFRMRFDLRMVQPKFNLGSEQIVVFEIFRVHQRHVKPQASGPIAHCSHQAACSVVVHNMLGGYGHTFGTLVVVVRILNQGLD